MNLDLRDAHLGHRSPGFNMYRVRFNGDDGAGGEHFETTGLGLGGTPPFVPLMRRVTVSPMVRRISLAWFDRASTKVLQAFRYDWEGSSSDLADNWSGGGVLKIHRIKPNPLTDQLDLRGTKGIKINWKWFPWVNSSCRKENPGPNVRALQVLTHLCGIPGKWGRNHSNACGCVIHDVENGMTPVAYCAFPSESPDTYPVEQIDEDTWQVVIDKVYSPDMSLASHLMAIIS